MIRRLLQKRYSPIGIDVGSRSVKLVQFNADYSRLIDAARWEWNEGPDRRMSDQERDERLSEAIRRAWEGRDFCGHDAVLCLNHEHLFLQNLRVPRGDRGALDRSVQQEAAGRIPFPVAETEIRYFEAADIHQGEALVREVILMACHRPILDRAVELVERGGLRPVAVDVEPAALLRACSLQCRRDEERRGRRMMVDIGYAATTVVIAEGDEILFLKYLDLAGRHFDEAVGRSLRMEWPEASQLRRHNGDRRSDRQDPEIARSVADALRPVLEKLVAELSMCVRYHSVTFRGQPLNRMLLSGGEATVELAEQLAARVGIPCELTDPFRTFETTINGVRKGQWNVAAGLALRQFENH